MERGSSTSCACTLPLLINAANATEPAIFPICLIFMVLGSSSWF